MREKAIVDTERPKRADDDEFNLTWHGKTKLTRRRKTKKDADSLAAAKAEDELLRNKIMGGRRK